MTNESRFPELPKQLADALEAKGFNALTPIQQAVLAPDLEQRDLRMSSQTGSGKTVAIGLVLAPHVTTETTARQKQKKKSTKSKTAKPSVLVVAPTRELALQLGGEFQWLYRGYGTQIATVTGGTNLAGDFAALAKNPTALIGTPGRLVDHIRRGLRGCLRRQCCGPR